MPDFLFFSLFQSYTIITTRIIKHLPVYKENWLYPNEIS